MGTDVEPANPREPPDKFDYTRYTLHTSLSAQTGLCEVAPGALSSDQ